MGVDRPTFTLDGALAAIAQLESLLRDANVRIETGSGLERAFLAAANWAYEARSPSGSALDARTDTRDALGAVNISANILSVREHPSFSELESHLRLLATADPSTFPQSRHSAVDCQLFELLVACWAMRAGANVTLESPRATAEPNPDVVALFDDISIGIACKAPVSASTETYYQRLREGAAQTLRRAGDTGRIVALNARTRIPFEALQPVRGKFGDSAEPPQYGAFEDAAEPSRILAREMERLNRELANLHLADVRHDEQSPMSRIDGWLFSAHAPTSIVAVAMRMIDGSLQRASGPVQASAKYAGSAKLFPADPRVHVFVDALAKEANRQLLSKDGSVALA